MSVGTPFSGSRVLPAAECHKCKPSGDLQIPLFTHFTQITAENQRIPHIFQAFPCPSVPTSLLRKQGTGPALASWLFDRAYGCEKIVDRKHFETEGWI